MRKLYIFFGLIVLAGLIITGLIFAETITLTTYYPAPYGVYKQLIVDTNLTDNAVPVTGLSVDIDDTGITGNISTVIGLDVDVSGVTTGTRYPLRVVGLPVYTTNALAVAGGLAVGAFYRTGANPDPVCVVH